MQFSAEHSRTIQASDFYTYFRPSECPLRLYLRRNGIMEEEPGPLQEVIIRLGNRHEEEHRTALERVLPGRRPEHAQDNSVLLLPTVYGFPRHSSLA